MSDKEESLSPDPSEVGASSLPEEVNEANDPVEEKREDARLTFTVLLILLFAFEILVGAVAVFAGDGAWMRAEEFLRVLVPATIGLLGSAIGFYFGSQR